METMDDRATSLKRRAAELKESLATVELELASDANARRAQKMADDELRMHQLEHQIDLLICQIPDRSRLNYRKEKPREIRERESADFQARAAAKDCDYWI